MWHNHKWALKVNYFLVPISSIDVAVTLSSLFPLTLYLTPEAVLPNSSQTSLIYLGTIKYIYKNKNHLKNEQRSRDAAAKKKS